MRPLLLITALLSAALPLHAGEEENIAARRSALDLAGAFTANDGYKIRDGFFTSALKQGQGRVVAVNLYSGNNYWFCAASGVGTPKLTVNVFDEDGHPTPILNYADASRAAAGFTPSHSGIYYVKISLVEGESSPVCLLYTYK